MLLVLNRCFSNSFLISAGEMAEWLKAHAWKACLGETLTWVRIPLSPPFLNDLAGPAISLQSLYGVGRALRPWSAPVPSHP